MQVKWDHYLPGDENLWITLLREGEKFLGSWHPQMAIKGTWTHFDMSLSPWYPNYTPFYTPLFLSVTQVLFLKPS
jgi:hypothetical protein